MTQHAEIFKLAWRCKCPQCRNGDLFKPGLTLDLRDKCSECGLNLSKNDTADGPAVFLIFILGFLLVPLALFIDALYSWPVWVHAVVWGALAIAMTVGALRPVKAYVIALQFQYRPEMFE